MLVKLTVMQNYSTHFYIIVFCVMTSCRLLAGTGVSEKSTASFMFASTLIKKESARLHVVITKKIALSVDGIMDFIQRPNSKILKY